MKIAAVYTGTKPSLMESVDTQLKKQIPDAEIIMFADPTILSDIIAAGGIYDVPAKKLYNLYFAAVNSGADIIYNICSSVGDLADKSKDIFSVMGIPVVRIDEDMAVNAVAKSDRIAIMATLSSTLEPTIALFNRIALKQNKQIEIVSVLVEGGYGLSPQQMNELIVKYAKSITQDVDAIVLAQASMAISEAAIEKACNIPVYSSPYYGAIKVKETVKMLEEQKRSMLND